MPRRKRISVIDLFCGCGGLSFGLKQAATTNGLDIDVRLAVDMNEDALAVFRQNVSSNPRKVVRKSIEAMFRSDLDAKVSNQESEFLKDFTDVDFLVAGPPCQGNSDLNNRTRRDDPRNDLYMLCARAIKLAQPTVVLINLPRVLSESFVVELANPSLPAIQSAS
jgi:DNA (cytosine-5)-methyltransferase 1